MLYMRPLRRAIAALRRDSDVEEVVSGSSAVNFALKVTLGLAIASSLIVVANEGARARAQFGVFDPIPGTIETLSIDVDITGNTPFSIASVDVCRTASVSDTFQVDIVVDEIPAEAVNGIALDLVYNPSVLRVVARDGGSSLLFTQALPQGFYFDSFSDGLPDVDGAYRHEAVELGGGLIESGEGVLVRLTIEVVGAGVSPLDLNELLGTDGVPGVPDVVDGSSGYYPPISKVVDGEIRADGMSCDLDSDGVQNPADNCLEIGNPGQEDQNSDGIGNACADLDGDGVDVADDNCPAQFNPIQTDANNDDIGDVCDSVGGDVLITSHSAGSRELPLALLAAVGALLIALVGVGSYWRLRTR